MINKTTCTENNTAMKTIPTPTETTPASCQFISPRNLAARWDVSKATIYRWQRVGILEPLRIAGTVRYSIEQVETLERK